MDFKYLAESGKYRKEGLTADRLTYIKGMEKALELVDQFAAGLCGDGEESTLEKMEREIKEAAMEEFKGTLTIEIVETVVGMLDEQEAEELEKQEKQYNTEAGIEDPLEPLKISSALDSEIRKWEYRVEHDPESISILDYTVMSALQEALERRTAGNG